MLKDIYLKKNKRETGLNPLSYPGICSLSIKFNTGDIITYDSRDLG